MRKGSRLRVSVGSTDLSISSENFIPSGYFTAWFQSTVRSAEGGKSQLVLQRASTELA